MEREELRIQLPRDARAEAVECMLREIRAIGLGVATGFVGNERYEGNITEGTRH
jgi:hypothetical protein